MVLFLGIKHRGLISKTFTLLIDMFFGLSKSASALSANILSHEGYQIENDLSLIQQYGAKLNKLFPYISTRRDYHYLVSAMCK